jgi:hypothetical protein
MLERPAMKTTVEVSDNLCRRAKAEAALRVVSSKTESKRDCGSCSKLRENRIDVGVWAH